MTTSPVTPGNDKPTVTALAPADAHAITMLASAISALADGRIEHAVFSINSALHSLAYDHGPLTDKDWAEATR